MPLSFHRTPAAARARIDLVIPVRNEQENISTLLAAIPRDLVRRVVVADNGSTDQTAALAGRGGATVVSEPQRGYGAACLAGIGFLGHTGAPDIIAFMDGDLADDPGFLARVCQPVVDARADLVIASRRRLAEPGALTAPQLLGNTLACTLIRCLTGARYSDLGPMRAIRWSSLQALNMKDRTWGWTVEMQYKAAVQGLRTEHLDVPYRRRRAGQSKISGTVLGSIRAGVGILSTIGFLWWQTRPHRCGGKFWPQSRSAS